MNDLNDVVGIGLELYEKVESKDWHFSDIKCISVKKEWDSFKYCIELYYEGLDYTEEGPGITTISKVETYKENDEYVLFDKESDAIDYLNKLAERIVGGQIYAIDLNEMRINNQSKWRLNE